MIYYVNESGSRWVSVGNMLFFSFEMTRDGSAYTLTRRTADCFEAVGNFARYVYRIRGKRHYGEASNLVAYSERDRRRLPIVNSTSLGSLEADSIIRNLGGEYAQ